MFTTSPYVDVSLIILPEAHSLVDSSRKCSKEQYFLNSYKLIAVYRLILYIQKSVS